MYENRSLISDWDTLRLVLAIDRHGGVSGAARSLGVTHATVSRRLAKSEEMAGMVFFKRLPAGLELTDAGNKLLSHAARIEPELHALERELLASDKGMSGALRITIPPLMMTDAASQDIVEFNRQFPEIRLEFVGDNNLLNLHQREADVAIRVSRKPPETLWGRKLTDQNAAYYAAQSLLDQNALGRGDMSADIPVIAFTSWPSIMPKRLIEICPNARVAARSDDMVTAIQLVRAGFGITRMPKILGDNLEGVVRIKQLPYEPYLPIWILTHPDIRKTPRIEAFMQHMASRIAKRRATYKVADE